MLGVAGATAVAAPEDLSAGVEGGGHGFGDGFKDRNLVDDALDDVLMVGNCLAEDTFSIGVVSHALPGGETALRAKMRVSNRMGCLRGWRRPAVVIIAA